MSPNNGQACTNLSSLPPNPPSANSIPVATSYFGSGSWMDIWNELSNDCKEEVVILDCEGILDLMEDYLKRHRYYKSCFILHWLSRPQFAQESFQSYQYFPPYLLEFICTKQYRNCRPCASYL